MGGEKGGDDGGGERPRLSDPGDGGQRKPLTVSRDLLKAALCSRQGSSNHTALKTFSASLHATKVHQAPTARALPSSALRGTQKEAMFPPLEIFLKG